MPVKLPEPHAKREAGRETIPLWRCPQCRKLKRSSDSASVGIPIRK